MSDFASHRVLIVEDEWLVRMELADAFEALGFGVFESASAEQAIDMLRDNPGIDLLVTDIRLSGFNDGWQLAVEARAARAELPVIYLSANQPASDRIVPGGVFIDKPALMSKVTEAARQLLGQAR